MIRESPQTPNLGRIDVDGAENYWLIAQDSGDRLACMMCVIGRPFGFVEFLLTTPGLSKVQTARVVSALTNAAHMALTRVGCSFVLGVIPKSMKSYRNVARRRGYVPVNTCSFMIKRLR